MTREDKIKTLTGIANGTLSVDVLNRQQMIDKFFAQCPTEYLKTAVNSSAGSAGRTQLDLMLNEWYLKQKSKL